MLATTAVTIVVVGVFNVFIDPLGVFSSPRIAGISAIKPYPDHHREFVRYASARHLCSDVGIFGNSRAEIGFDPESIALATQGLSAYNHAIPGTSATTSYRQILWLQAANCLPMKIILGVEFFDFLGGTSSRPLPTLRTDPAPRLDVRFFAESVFSITGVRDSLATLFLQRSRYPATLTERGFNPLYHYIPEVEQSGQYVLFRQRAEENFRKWTHKPLRLRPTDGGVSDDEQAVKAILDTLAQAGAKTHIIIYPYHAQIRMMIERLGMGGLFSDWKRLVFAVAESQRSRGNSVEVWDFSGVAPETREAIPIKGDRKTHLAHYWEAGHFKKELGDLVIARVFGDQRNFGVKLERDNIDNWLLLDRQRVQSLLTTPSPLLDEVNDILSDH
ncbi:hypothetical protein [Noviherbaspirillum cavernae]|nr:hypothetical protein [Noviherbaspirillum cavernae]